MLRHRIAQQIVDGADPGSRRSGPFARLAALVRFRPEKLEPVGRVRTKRRVIERLKIERIRTARDQHAGESLGLWMSRLTAFTAANDSCKNGERVLTVGPRDFWIGAMVQQHCRNLNGVLRHSVDG